MSDPILELLAAPPNPSMRVDETAVYAGGRRRVRRRAVRRGALGMVGVVGAATIAFAALGTGVDRSALPAGPSPSGGTAGRVSADVLDGRFAVEVVPGAPADQPNVIFYAVKDGKRQQLAGSSGTADVVSMGTGSGAEGVMLGTAPAEATAFLTVTRDGTSTDGLEMDKQPLPGTDYQAVALDFEDPSGPERYLDTVWLDRSGTVRSGIGQRLPSVLVPGTTDRVFVAREAGRLGVFIESGGSLTPLRSSGPTELGYGEKPDGGDWTWRSSVLLPAGATDVRFRWSPSTRGGEVTLLPLPDRAGTVATAPADGDGPALLAVTWTDDSGGRHTDAVE